VAAAVAVALLPAMRRATVASAESRTPTRAAVAVRRALVEQAPTQAPPVRVASAPTTEASVVVAAAARPEPLAAQVVQEALRAAVAVAAAVAHPLVEPVALAVLGMRR
jgi:hypothetical protein